MLAAQERLRRTGGQNAQLLPKAKVLPPLPGLSFEQHRMQFVAMGVRVFPAQRCPPAMRWPELVERRACRESFDGFDGIRRLFGTWRGRSIHRLRCETCRRHGFVARNHATTRTRCKRHPAMSKNGQAAQDAGVALERSGRAFPRFHAGKGPRVSRALPWGSYVR